MTEPIAQNRSQVLAAKRWMDDEAGMERASLFDVAVCDAVRPRCAKQDSVTVEAAGILARVPNSLSNDPVLLWGSPSGVHCTLIRQGPLKPFVVMVRDGADVIKRLTFEHDEDASAYAIWAMRADAAKRSLEGAPDPTGDPTDSSSSSS